MKKLLSLSLAVLTACALALPTFALFEDAPSIGNIKLDVPATTAAPKIDGKIGDGEYSKIDVKKEWLSIATGNDDKADEAKNRKFDFYMTYDNANLYFAVSAEAKKADYICNVDAASIWGQAAVQIGLGRPGTSGNDYLELGYGRNSETGELLSTTWLTPTVGEGLTPEAGKDFAIDYANDTLTYEISVPWTSFLEAAPKLGDTFCFAFVVAAGDSNNPDVNYMHTQIASGVTGNGKTAENFAIATLKEAPAPVTTAAPETVAAPVTEAAPAPAPVAEATPAPAPAAPVEAPQTGDIATVALAVISLLSFAGFVVLKKAK